MTMFVALMSSRALAVYGHFDEFENDTQNLNKVNLIIPKGSFFRGFIGQTISSEFNNNGDVVKILITSDFSLNDKIILPKNSVFVGTIKNLEKAQQGRNGFFSIDLNSLIFPDNRQFSAKGYLIANNNSRIFGGEFSKRSGYKTTLHRSASFGNKGTLQLQQNGPRTIGKETKINMGQFVTIVLEEPIEIN